ncbi:DNA-binding protein [Clostridia bacterium]|nr:DNA-binding protein [Clostridia bacterium]
MTNRELLEYWVESSDNDYTTMQHLYSTQDYNWALFLGHLVIEKLLKGLYARKNEEQPHAPKIHNLLILAERCDLELSQELRDELSLITHFNMNARYEDYKLNFYKKATREYADIHINKIEEIRGWLKAKSI